MPEFSGRKVAPKDEESIAQEWNALASIRLEQIDSGIDRSFDEVLAPSVLRAIEPTEGLRVLDVGCGTGTLTELIATHSDHVTGVDISEKSIELAKKHHSSPSIDYLAMSVEEYASTFEIKFDMVVANMVLMDVADLRSVVAAIARLSKPGARFVATITHPLFWPVYWGYATEPWFSYLDEIFIEAPFEISAQLVQEPSTHIHRPLQAYFSEFYAAGFHDIGLCELAPPEVPSQAAVSVVATYPRFAMLTGSAAVFDS